ncbi:hypothetical protein EVAR_17038_1 [Eumeta japonica]|uniref:Uncharacterized protein n=1 Tax=Eumeta variegata TaxID=151549 RepID=A0A4C1V617_EUMVA|nr:hypothetical protein EVAR_17038_1 [Eumeta japonica]
MAGRAITSSCRSRNLISARARDALGAVTLLCMAWAGLGGDLATRLIRPSARGPNEPHPLRRDVYGALCYCNTCEKYLELEQRDGEDTIGSKPFEECHIIPRNVDLLAHSTSITSLPIRHRIPSQEVSKALVTPLDVVMDYSDHRLLGGWDAHLSLENEKKKEEEAAFVLTKTIEREAIQPGVIGCAHAALELCHGLSDSQFWYIRKVSRFFEPRETKSGPNPKAAMDRARPREPEGYYPLCYATLHTGGGAGNE